LTFPKERIVTHDITEYDENKQDYIEDESIEDDSAPPLCLVHYYAERTAYPPAFRF